MKVSIKDFSVTMELRNKGIELDVYDGNDQHLGDFRIGKASIEWCKGKMRKGHGTEKSWVDLIHFFESSH